MNIILFLLWTVYNIIWSTWESSNHTQLFYMCIYMPMFVDQARPSTRCHTTPIVSIILMFLLSVANHSVTTNPMYYLRWFPFNHGPGMLHSIAFWLYFNRCCFFFKYYTLLYIFLIFLKRFCNKLGKKKYPNYN